MGVPSTNQTKPKVLIVDVEPLITGTLAKILNEDGFQAVGVDGGDDAFRSAEEWQPDILVTDFLMPGLNGVEVAKQIHAMLPGCRIFLFSAHFEVADRVRACREVGYPFEFIA